MANDISLGWSALIVHDKGDDYWCRFKPDYGLMITSDMIECETLDPNLKRCNVVFDDNNGNERQCTIIFRQRMTNAIKTIVVKQEAGAEGGTEPLQVIEE